MSLFMCIEKKIGSISNFKFNFRHWEWFSCWHEGIIRSMCAIIAISKIGHLLGGANKRTNENFNKIDSVICDSSLMSFFDVYVFIHRIITQQILAILHRWPFILEAVPFQKHMQKENWHRSKKRDKNRTNDRNTNVWPQVCRLYCLAA